jgi:hypothetical protein
MEKYYPWGNCLIGYTHGVEEPLRDLPSIMATEEPNYGVIRNIEKFILVINIRRCKCIG